ncbi:MAG: hypothetical protein QM661_12600 [Solimonas sp.]
MPPLLGVVAALLMVRLIQPAAHDGTALRTLDDIELVAPPPAHDEPPDAQLAAAPAPPPEAPPSLARPGLPSSCR